MEEGSNGEDDEEEDKVVVLTSKTLQIKSQRAARDVSFLINNTDQKSLTQRRSSLMGWDSSLEDVQVGVPSSDPGGPFR